MTLRCVDIETTGTDPSRDAIVEIASVDLQRDRTITNFQETLVRPSIAVPAVASAIHHLIDTDLASASPLEAVIKPFKGADAYVAHNCSFERSFLGPLFGDTIWVCTYKCALRVWPDLAAHGNQALRYHFGHINPLGVDRARLVPHRALSDAIVTAAIFFELVKHASWPELVRWSEEPALLTYLRFGMHRGSQARADCPRSRASDAAHGGAALQFEIELTSLDQLEGFRHQGVGSKKETKDWMHAFSEVLLSPPAVEILRVDERTPVMP